MSLLLWQPLDSRRLKKLHLQEADTQTLDKTEAGPEKPRMLAAAATWLGWNKEEEAAAYR